MAVYIDGFNLYYGKLKGKPARKWLDLEALGRRLAGQQVLVKVRYFTAWVSGKGDSQAPRRQQVYMRALRSVPLVEPHFGHFETREKTRSLVTTGRPVRILNTEEKGSDVNLATWLLLDGMDGVYDEAIVVSNDSDLEEPIRQANVRFGPIHVVSPHTLTKGPPFTHIYSLEKAAASYRSLTVAEVTGSQLSATVALPKGKSVTRPTGWQ